MGLSICYDLSLPAEAPVADVGGLLAQLRDEAKTLPFDEISEPVQLDASSLASPWPVQGLAFKSLEGVVDLFGRMSREQLHRERLGVADDEYRHVKVPGATKQGTSSRVIRGSCFNESRNEPHRRAVRRSVFGRVRESGRR